MNAPLYISVFLLNIMYMDITALCLISEVLSLPSVPTGLSTHINNEQPSIDPLSGQTLTPRTDDTLILTAPDEEVSSLQGLIEVKEPSKHKVTFADPISEIVLDSSPTAPTLSLVERFVSAEGALYGLTPLLLFL